MKHKINKIHFVGIGGSGMSGIAEVLLNQGYTISGSDTSDNAATRKLRQTGVSIYIGHAADQVDGADVVVVSSAIKADNPEIKEARRRNIPVVPRAIMLAELMRLKQGIAVAGTHGKTTTTSLIASILGMAGLDPTYVIGGRLNAVGSNAKLGGGELIVAEADESDASFLHLNPMMAVVTNIDADHMDTYEHDFAKLQQAFIDFLQRLPFYGRAVLCIDDVTVRHIAATLEKPVTTYGFSTDADMYAENICAYQRQMQFDAVWTKDGEQRHRLPITLNLPGRHNVLNALAAIVVALEVGCTEADIQRALREFGGVGRRFQSYGELPAVGGGTFTLIDDYGHHPVELAATINAARGAFPERRLVVAFQPHRYTRTRDLFAGFVQVLSTVDSLLLADVYPAGETPIDAADSQSLAQALRQNSTLNPILVADMATMAEQIVAVAQAGDVVMTMGAGSIGSVPAQVVSLQGSEKTK